MQDIGLVKLSQTIYDYCGLNFVDRLPNLEQKVQRRIKEQGMSYQAYCDFLKKNPQEWDVLIEILTINETYFYREENQFIECSTVVLPKLKEKIKNRPIRIWSAACSTGEEPYTMAMMIHDTGRFLPGTVQIIATDINKKVLKKAETGFYHSGSLAFRRIPERLLKKYFMETSEGFQVNPSIRKMVQFKEVNLLNRSQMEQVGTVDVIFCRNVLIYFDQKTTRQVIRSLHQRLSPGGYLFLGHAESITDMDLGFKKVDSDKTFYYRKDSD